MKIVHTLTCFVIKELEMLNIQDVKLIGYPIKLLTKTKVCKMYKYAKVPTSWNAVIMMHVVIVWHSNGKYKLGEKAELLDIKGLSDLKRRINKVQFDKTIKHQNMWRPLLALLKTAIYRKSVKILTYKKFRYFVLMGQENNHTSNKKMKLNFCLLFPK